MQLSDCCSTRVIQPTYCMASLWKQSGCRSLISEEELRGKAIMCIIRGFVINRRRNKAFAWLNGQKNRAALKETSAIMLKLNVMRSCGGNLFKFQTDLNYILQISSNEPLLHTVQGIILIVISWSDSTMIIINPIIAHTPLCSYCNSFIYLFNLALMMM